ncbi:hypothetical protein PACTADRAFT_34728 [Pachysolen tannophilus NRRL Y-2460]|uniref:Ammonium transporter n=1 Tax=Pachysolen tannophilus NRRL Y-2460 TaxID=669874 RepID=A0A1E4TTB3_PACTA|nr:hypothetical protein PACTADRAFT_34728 [Pachysolen tannophilus NRRL Y-2460]
MSTSKTSILVEILAKRKVWEETYNDGAIILLAVGCAMVFIMIPALGYLYSGLARRSSALSLIQVCILAGFVGMFQWYFWGYSLAFSSTATNGFIGNLHNFGFQNVLGGEDYPELAFAIFQMMFLCVTLAIIVGATCERGRLIPSMIFCFIWATLVYCPIACAVWNTNSGWAAKWGVLDYAGGGPVEIASGVSGFVYSAFLGKRKERRIGNFKPHNVSMVTLGTMLLYFGWLGFNGFSCIYPSLRVVYAIMNTNLSAAFGALTWVILDWRIEKKWSAVGLCSGCISGLVAATPSSGCITLYGSVIQGVIAGIICNYSTKIKFLLKVDDSLDILAEHGLAGVVGLLFNAFFGSSDIIGYDGQTDAEGGFITHDYRSIYKQICYILFAIGYSTVVTTIICFIMERIPFLKLRVSEEAEERGLDEDQVGEFAYDYVEVRRDFLSWGVPPPADSEAFNVANQYGAANDVMKEKNAAHFNHGKNSDETSEDNNERGNQEIHVQDNVSSDGNDGHAVITGSTVIDVS